MTPGPPPAADPRERFAATADRYHLYRPGYPEALVDWVLAAFPKESPARRAADIGCGTGIATRLFAARGGLEVVGVDPNEAMLAKAREAGGAGVAYVRGEAAATGLPDASVDVVTCGQAFHWFDRDPALREIRRILRPGGLAAAFWNVRDETASPLLREYAALFRVYVPRYDPLANIRRALDGLRTAAGVADIAEASFRHAQTLDREGFFGRVYSGSYIIHDLEGRREDFDREVGALFDRHARGGRVVELAYRTEAIRFRLGVA